MDVVLVVDSEGEVTESVSGAFAGKAGLHTIIERRTGRSAISALQEGMQVDIAVIDDRFEDMDGVDLLRSLREILPKLPVIMTSGHASVESYLKALTAGAFEFIARPISCSGLRKIMNAALEKNILSPNLRVESPFQENAGPYVP